MMNQLWVLGAVIVTAVMIQSLWMAWDVVRRVSHRGEQRMREAEILAVRLDAARKHRDLEHDKSLVWSGWRKFVIRKRNFEDRDQQVCSFHLEPHDGKPIPAYSPGQFLTFKLDIPGQAKPTVRCYSLSDAPRSGSYRVSIKRVPAPRGTDLPPGLASNYFHGLEQGEILDVKAPSGAFVLDLADAAPVVLIAGGVGITPLLSMLNSIVTAPGRRETWFLYGCRCGGEHMMKEHLARIASDHANVHLHVCYSEPAGDDAEGSDFQHKGWISIDLMKKLLPSSNYDFFVCGPPPMMNATLEGLAAWGVPETRVHFEKFGPGPPRKKAEPIAADGAKVETIEVVYKKSGKTLQWRPAAGTLLDLAREHDIEIESGCELGNCGTCQTAIHSGKVKYLSEPSFEAESGTCLMCCCVPAGPIVVDA